MKRILILLLSLIFGLIVCATEKFETLNVEVPCNIKIFKSDNYLVRILDKRGKISQDVIWEVRDNVLEIKGYAYNENDNTVIIFTPVEQKILIDREKFTLREDSIK